MTKGAAFLVDFLTCLRFATRLPLPAFAFETARDDFSGFARALRLLPLVGAVVGLFGAGVLCAALAIGLAPLLAAPLALCATIAATGALHEDGLADCADGFGGATRERRLEIMADSRIGAFGALAIALSLYLRIAAVALIAATSAPLAAAVLAGSASASRAACLIPLAWLPPARAKGAGSSAGRLGQLSLAGAAAVAAAFSAAPALAGASLARSALAFAGCAAAGFAAAALARRRIGGQTGDVAGAAQQIAEILFLLIFAARA